MKHTISNFIRCITLLSITVFSSCESSENEESLNKNRPNVLLVMTDDQGIGDFGFMGNPYVKTANLDKLASESLHLTNFYVSPVCAPTRASLMTGRYSERTGVYDTFNGGAIMSDSEITIAEVLKENGYKTGIFGKWHLGDNYPYRPIDQGFDEAIVHRGGGIGQPGDFPNFFANDSSYFDPVLFHNGVQQNTQGYCSDVFSNAAIDFIKDHNANGSDQPFFAYVSYNAPHTPLQLPQKYYDMYKDLEFDIGAFDVKDEAVNRMTKNDIEAAKRVYGMVTNIDDNIGNILQTLKEEQLEDNTIVIFLTDNGPQQVRYKMGFRKRKSSVYNGGVRVPCLMRYPEKYPEKTASDMRIAHIDLMPSILDLCGIDLPGHKIDGRSFIDAPMESKKIFDDRALFFEWGRGFPVRYRNFAVINGDYKLVGNTGANSAIEDFELYNLKDDPYENINLVHEHNAIAIDLKNEIDAWYKEIMAEENNNKVLPAYVGSDAENPTILNRNDAKGTPVAWRNEDAMGYWDINVMETSRYEVALQFINQVNEPGNMHLKVYPKYILQKNVEQSDWLTFENVELKKGFFKLEAYYTTNKGRNIFPLYVSLKKLD